MKTQITNLLNILSNTEVKDMALAVKETLEFGNKKQQGLSVLQNCGIYSVTGGVLVQEGDSHINKSLSLLYEPSSKQNESP